MTRSAQFALRGTLAALAVALAPFSARAEIDLEATWRPPTYDEVRTDVATWSRDADLPPSAAERIKQLWPDKAPVKSGEADLLDRLAETFAAVYPDAQRLVDACRADYSGP